MARRVDGFVKLDEPEDFGLFLIWPGERPLVDDAPLDIVVKAGNYQEAAQVGGGYLKESWETNGGNCPFRRIRVTRLQGQECLMEQGGGLMYTREQHEPVYDITREDHRRWRRVA